MKYSVYVRTPNETNTVINMDSLERAAKVYYGIIVSCGCPRLAVDGKELRIFEADKIVYRSVRNAAGVMHNAQVRNEILKARKQA